MNYGKLPTSFPQFGLRLKSGSVKIGLCFAIPMVEIIMVTLIETSNLSDTTTIRTLSTQEAERIYTFKLLVSKLLGGEAQ